MNDLVLVRDNTTLTTTKIISIETNVKHQNVLQLFKRHEGTIKNFGVIMFDSINPKKGGLGGRPETLYYLNENQLTYFLMLMRNSDKVIEFKIKIAKEFIRMKETLNNIAKEGINDNWSEIRLKGKVSRRKETDIIKRFIKYAVEQGSKSYKKNPSLAYTNITKMENKSLFILENKVENLRDILNCKQLHEIKQADEIVEKALDDGMKQGLHYKEIYKLAKSRVELFSSLKGKSIVGFKNLELN